jgi:outer membrane immunogenic protein
VKKILLLATISQLALIAVGSANAADLRLKAPPMVAPPAYSWTGCYVGGHVGYGWGRQDVTSSNFSFGNPSGGISGTNTLDSSGGIYGLQGGCNYQFAGNWVVGIQGDIAGANLSGSAVDPLNGSGNPAQFGFSIGMKTDRIASVTGRLGVTGWNNLALFYVKGGAAWDKNQWNFLQTFNCINSGCTTPSADDRRSGWTIGGGVEWVISPAWSNWTAFAEYNYYRFGDGPSFVFFDPRNNITSKQEIQTVKVGLNYKLFNP